MSSTAPSTVIRITSGRDKTDMEEKRKLQKENKESQKVNDYNIAIKAFLLITMLALILFLILDFTNLIIHL